MKVKKAIIPLSGLATRFLPASKSVPKEMFPVVDKPIIQYLIEELSACGVTDILLLIGRNRECLMNHFDKTPELFETLEKENKFELLDKALKPCKLATITYKRVYEPRGVAEALLIAKEFTCGEPFIVAFGDEMFYNPNLSATQQLINEFNNVKHSVLGCYEIPKEDVYKYGILDVKQNKNGLLIETIVEKPAVDKAPSNLCAIGKYLLTNDIFEKLEIANENFNKETNFTDALELLAKDDKLYALTLKGERFDTGTKLGYVMANIFYALQDNDISNQLKNEISKL